ncbi:hypothetical protein [Streptomyces sp. MW-W600-10]|uniref:hypothetical protein n=1 Tax=Streptomyces sp. MW-W600-10 TaxID=2829819 RepID=UPI001C47745E|nr:hypothetical protein [Streptomyces sp. MW-W600-10]MBV7246665.1 hypothetical protein [Streptomyces sp. MW-W600-10]
MPEPVLGVLCLSGRLVEAAEHQADLRASVRHTLQLALGALHHEFRQIRIPLYGFEGVEPQAERHGRSVRTGHRVPGQRGEAPPGVGLRTWDQHPGDAVPDLGRPREGVVERLLSRLRCLRLVERAQFAQQTRRDGGVVRTAPGQVHGDAYQQMAVRVGVRAAGPPPLVPELRADGEERGDTVVLGPVVGVSRPAIPAGPVLQPLLLVLRPRAAQLHRVDADQHPGAGLSAEAVGVVRPVAHRGDHRDAQADEFGEERRSQAVVAEVTLQLVQPDHAPVLAPAAQHGGQAAQIRAGRGGEEAVRARQVREHRRPGGPALPGQRLAGHQDQPTGPGGGADPLLQHGVAVPGDVRGQRWLIADPPGTPHSEGDRVGRVEPWPFGDRGQAGGLLLPVIGVHAAAEGPGLDDRRVKGAPRDGVAYAHHRAVRRFPFPGHTHPPPLVKPLPSPY